MTADEMRRWEIWSRLRWLVGALIATPCLIVLFGTAMVWEYKQTFPGEPPIFRPQAAQMIALFSLVAATFLVAAVVAVLVGKTNRNGWATFIPATLALLIAALAIGRAAWINFVLLA